ncbi:MAG TPA: hypothetical protein VIY73_14915 [Polyangiaceae bacterium]
MVGNGKKNAAVLLEAAVKAALRDEENEGPALRALIVGLIACVRAAFRNSPAALADFGLTPMKSRGPRARGQAAGAAARRKATRRARGIRGRGRASR